LSVSLATRRRAVSLLFLLPGLGMASWVTRTPDARDRLGASTAEMGLVLLGLSVGSMTGILGSARLLRRWTRRQVITAGTCGVVAGVAVVGLGASTRSAPLVALGLASFGFGMGTGEVALNVEGAEVERASGRSLLPSMHGFYSLGTVLGAVIGMAATARRVPMVLHLGVVAVVVAVGLAVALRGIPTVSEPTSDAGDDRPAPDDRRAAASAPVWRDRRLQAIGLVILALAMSEGTANDWLPLVMVDGHGFSASIGSAVFTLFATAMTVGRFVGGRFVDRHGRARTLRVSALVGAAGLAAVALVDQRGVAIVAVALWGLGASLGFPLALSAAADSGPEVEARMSFAAMLGYVAFLVGPPTLGLLGEHLGLRSAMLVVLGLVLAASFVTSAADSPTVAATTSASTSS
jgi:fucose permease